MRKQGYGGQKDISKQLFILKDENERLRQMAMNYDEIERMKQENKEMRLELQRLKNLAISEYNDQHSTSPKSFDGRIPVSTTHRKKENTLISE
jgi:hypothetical protein